MHGAKGLGAEGVVTMKPIDPAEVRKAKNESGVAPEEVAERLAPENSVEISYGKITLRIERHTVEYWRWYAAQFTPDQRQAQMSMLDRYLRKTAPRIGPRLSKKKNDEAAEALVLWHALKELAS